MSNNEEDISITFGMIVLNGEPFIKYNLRALYPFAHQIIVVEGASFNSRHCATEDGHSIDKTLEILREFKRTEDPENKITIVTAEDEGHSNGFWPGEKDEQSQAYAKRATGTWLWQIDADEFYKESDMKSIIKMLEDDTSITTISFPELPFWGSFDYICNGIFLRYRYSEVHRLFKWRQGYKYSTHRPVTIVNKEGVDLRELHWVRANDLREKRIYLYHYYKIFLGQVSSKMLYYANLVDATSAGKKIVDKSDEYYEETFLKLKKPFRIHTINAWPSWLEKFDGEHPTQIKILRNDIETGSIQEPMRSMDDVDDMTKSIRYRAGIIFWKIWGNYLSQMNWLLRGFLRGRIGSIEFFKTFFQILIGRKRLF